MLAMADGCGPDVRCARGASSRGAWSRGLTVETGGGGRWRMVGGRGPARLWLWSATPATVPRTKRERGPCLTGSSMLFNPFPPLITSSVRLSQRRARAGQGEALAGRWAATHLAEAGQSETEAGRRLRFSRPAHHEKGTKGTGRRAGPGPSPSPSPSPGRGGRGGVLTWKEGEAGWTHALREGGGGVRTLHSQPPSVAMIGPDEVHRGLMEVWDVFRVVHAGEVRMGGCPAVHSRSRCRVRPFFFLPSSPSFFPSVRWHGSVWIRGKHTRAPWRPIEGPYEGSLERGGGVGGLYLSANLGWWSSA